MLFFADEPTDEQTDLSSAEQDSIYNKGRSIQYSKVQSCNCSGASSPPRLLSLREQNQQHMMNNHGTTKVY